MVWQTTSSGSPDLLGELPIELSAWLRSGGRMTVVKKGQALFEGGAPSDGCYWLHEGVLKLSGASNHGAERILAIYGAGSLVGVSTAIDGVPRAASICALRDSSLTFFARGTFLEYLNGSPSLYGYLVKTLSSRLRHANDEIMAASFLSLRSRVARALLKFAEHLGEPTVEPDYVLIRELRQEDVAALADVARESVSRILSEWRRRRLIVPQTPSVYIIRRSTLEREAGVTSRA